MTMKASFLKFDKTVALLALSSRCSDMSDMSQPTMMSLRTQQVLKTKEISEKLVRFVISSVCRSLKLFAGRLNSSGVNDVDVFGTD